MLDSKLQVLERDEGSAKRNRMEKRLEKQGCSIGYTVRGSGPQVLFIQGVGVQGDAWLPQIESLQSKFTCVSFDNRGMGKSQPIGVRVTVSQMAEDAVSILEAENVASCHVVGHSLGGLVALQLALSAKSRVRSLSLLCTFPSGSMAAPLSLRMIWFGLRSQLGTRKMRRRGFMHLVCPPGPISKIDEEAHKIGQLFGHDLGAQPDIVPHQLRAMKGADLRPRLAELNDLPTLVVSATHDPIAPPSAGKFIQGGIRGSRYFEVGDASHGLPITHAAQLNRMLIDFFEEQD